MRRFRRFNNGTYTEKYAENNNEYNLISTMNEVSILSNNCGLEDDFFQSTNKPITYISSKLGVSKNQAVFLSILAEDYDSNNSLENIGHHIGISKLEMLQYKNELDELVTKRLVYPCCGHRSDEVLYKLPFEVIETFLTHNDFVMEKEENLNCNEFFFSLGKLFERAEDDDLPFIYLNKELNILLTNNTELKFVEHIQTCKLPEAEQLILLYACHKLVNEEVDELSSNDIFSLQNCKQDLLPILRSLNCENSLLQKNNLIQKQVKDGYISREYFTLTNRVKSEFLSELDIFVLDYSTVERLRKRREKRKTLQNSIPEIKRKWKATFPQLSEDAINELCKKYQIINEEIVPISINESIINWL